MQDAVDGGAMGVEEVGEGGLGGETGDVEDETMVG